MTGNLVSDRPTTPGRDVPEAVRALSQISLASVLDQSVDCVKLIGLDGNVQYMNANGLCAMEVDDFCSIAGRRWVDLWPDEAKREIEASYTIAATGEAARFRAYCPTAKGAARWWDVTVSPVYGAGGHVGYLSISRDVTENQLSREALEVAAAELKHRLKNTYTMIISLLRAHARGDAATEAFSASMGERLAALSTAQFLFVADQAPGAIDRLLPALVTPFASAICPIDIGTLPARTVDQGQADAIALVVGELSVNSAKHGALARGGRVAVTASESAGLLHIGWSERVDGAILAHERAGGQGLRLMERIVRARKGDFKIDWLDRGLDVSLTFAVL